MTNEEFLDAVPWYLGVASGALGAHNRDETQRLASRMFWTGPWYFALCDLARRHAEEYAQLVETQKKAACERYGAANWDEQEPLRGQ